MRNGHREICRIKQDYIESNEFLPKFNVFIPEANGSGSIGEVLSTPLVGEPLVGEPLVGSTDTFLSIGKFETRDEAEACLKYVKSRFARTLLGTLKVTQHNPKPTWANVPLQDFTGASDIDWTQSIDDIDGQLYKKYGLSETEIKFIQTNIRPMD